MTEQKACFSFFQLPHMSDRDSVSHGSIDYRSPSVPCRGEWYSMGDVPPRLRLDPLLEERRPISTIRIPHSGEIDISPLRNQYYRCFT